VPGISVSVPVAITDDMIRLNDDGRHRSRAILFEDVMQMSPETVWRGDPKALLP
jgi:hypothetical protein